MNHFEPREDHADRDDHHAAKPDRHVSLEDFEFAVDARLQRGKIGLGGELCECCG
jgi:hypothetical protein